MNWKTWMPLALAIVLGLIAAKVARDALARSREGQRGQVKTVRLVVAKAPVSPGQELTADVLALGPISAEAAPSGSFPDPSAVVGRVTAAPLLAGQPVMETLLAPRGATAGLQALVPRGMRAITLEVNETTGVAGMITPGCRVDVVCTLTGANTNDTVSTTVVQDVLVQAVGQRTMPGRAADDKDASPVKSVTLIATPRDAEAINLATSTGRTRLLLRGSNDRAVADTFGVTYLDLRGEDPAGPSLPPVVPTPVPPVEVVKVPTPPVTPPATQPVATTQPAADPFAEPVKNRRTVTLIKGGTRTEVVFDLGPKARDVKRPDDKPGEPAAGDVVTSTRDGNPE
jgi:pilus assembly protein CpaB